MSAPPMICVILPELPTAKPRVMVDIRLAAADGFTAAANAGATRGTTWVKRFAARRLAFNISRYL